MTLLERTRRIARPIGLLLAAILLALGVWRGLESPLLRLRIVEVSEPSPPLTAAEIERLAGVEAGRESLLKLSLAEVERRLLAHPWVRSVRLETRFPQTLSIRVEVREPQALHLSGTAARLVDSDGTLFGEASAQQRRSLPWLTGFSVDSKADLVAAVALIGEWRRWDIEGTRPLSQIARIGDGGLVAWCGAGRDRTSIRFARETLEPKIARRAPVGRLRSVLESLRKRGVFPRRLELDREDRIVARLSAPGSP